MNKIFYIVFACLLTIYIFQIAYADNLLDSNNTHKAPFYFFYSTSCPHCHNVDAFLKSIEDKYDFNAIKINVDLEDNVKFFVKTMQDFNINNYGIPVVVINNKLYQGDSIIIKNIVNEINICNINKCELYDSNNFEKPKEEKKISFLTILGLALADSVNPCEIAVLMILLATVLMKGNRKSVLSYGFAFIITIFLVYFAMGLGLIFGIKFLNNFINTNIIYLIVGIFALILAALNIKDAISYGAGNFVMEVPRSWRPTMKKILESVTSVWSVILIAFIVAFFLTPCTAGPYVLVSGLLHSLPINEIMMWLTVYNIIFVLPMIAIVFLIYFGLFKLETLQRLRENNIKTLHWISGIILFIIAIYLIITALI
jgi:glutaredoxin-related protein